MAWIYLVLAGLGEVTGVIALNLTNGFHNKKPLFFGIPATVASFYFLSLAMREIPVGTAYSIWTGIGAAGSVLIGMLFFRESKDWLRILFLSLIIIGVIGLRFIGH
ncbi:DMT family transporter [Risungbinella massiliensis]|uniref:DMT family transporter n=1 Tax=Risungbinella massiliensis TaxID=1329796 RepID=UPI0005CBF2D6|nr:multidrug efflux SMR transporter [Risungbinella massiliensis]